jgi:hypothetical protein
MKKAIAQLAMSVLRQQYGDQRADAIRVAYLHHRERDQRDFTSLVPTSVIHSLLKHAKLMDSLDAEQFFAADPATKESKTSSATFLFDAAGRLRRGKARDAVVLPGPMPFKSFQQAHAECGHVVHVPPSPGPQHPNFGTGSGGQP